MNKSIPGPWFISVPYENKELWVKAKNSEVEICHISPVGPPDEDWSETERDNARLISAAPDLLEACRAAIQLTVCNNAPGSKMVVKEMLRKAINKAEGK